MSWPAGGRGHEPSWAGGSDGQPRSGASIGNRSPALETGDQSLAVLQLQRCPSSSGERIWRMRGVRLLEVVLPVSLIAAGSGCGDNADLNISGQECGEGTHEVDGVCVPGDIDPIECGDGTVEVDGECVSPWLEPGTFRSPLVQLQRLAGLNDHMHLDEVRFVASNQRLYVCSYDFA